MTTKKTDKAETVKPTLKPAQRRKLAADPTYQATVKGIREAIAKQAESTGVKLTPSQHTAEVDKACRAAGVPAYYSERIGAVVKADRRKEAKAAVKAGRKRKPLSRRTATRKDSRPARLPGWTLAAQRARLARWPA
jgi:hypothetical protein